MVTRADIVRMEIECCAYPYHVPDPEYPECGPDNMIRIAEQYGILIAFTGDEDSYFWLYEIQGPRENLVRFLAAEYAGDEANAIECINDWIDWRTTNPIST